MGVTVWAMVEFEADDAMATAAWIYADEVDQVVLLSPDKDLSQCVIEDSVVTYDRRQEVERNEAGVWQKFGVAPVSIPDYLALVGDTADGIPGLPGWGAKSTASVAIPSAVSKPKVTSVIATSLSMVFGKVTTLRPFSRRRKAFF